MTKTLVKIGARSSKLSIKHTKIIISAIKRTHIGRFFDFEIVKIDTSGDVPSRKNGDKINNKGLFTKEIHEKIKNGEIDIAIHSAKDLQVNLANENKIVCVFKRFDPSDTFFSNKYKSFFNVPISGKIGTSSVRRAEIIRTIRPDIKIVPIRGNIDSRMELIGNGILDGIILSDCGPKNLKLRNFKYKFKLDKRLFIPSIAQGTIVVEGLKDCSNLLLLEALKIISCKKSTFEIEKERQLARSIGLECGSSLGFNISANFQKKECKMNLFFTNQSGEMIRFRDIKSDIKDIDKHLSVIGRKVQYLM
jgi:hydroxymethylbilane synthase